MNERSEFHVKNRHLVEGRGLTAQHIIGGKVVGEATYKVIGRITREEGEDSVILHATGGQLLEVPLPSVLNGGTGSLRFTGVLSREEISGTFFAPIRGNTR